jgi:ferredoxin
VAEIRIDLEKCMGSGNCSYWAPGSFDLDDDGKVLVRDPATDEESRLVMAAEGCPVGAISIWHGERRIDQGAP